MNIINEHSSALVNPMDSLNNIISYTIILIKKYDSFKIERIQCYEKGSHFLIVQFDNDEDVNNKDNIIGLWLTDENGKRKDNILFTCHIGSAYEFNRWITEAEKDNLTDYLEEEWNEKF